VPPCAGIGHDAQASKRPSMKLPLLTADDKLAEIKRLYYRTTRHTIKEDFARALQLLKSMDSEEQRERAAVYMDGLSQMRSDWAAPSQRKKVKAKGRRKKAQADVIMSAWRLLPT